MAATKQNLDSIHRGDDRTYTVQFRDSDGNAIDISATTLWHTLKENEDDTDANAVLQVSTTFPSDATSQAGNGTISIADTDTASLTPGIRYFYDFQWVDSSGNIYTVGWGRIKVEQDTTISTS